MIINNPSLPEKDVKVVIVDSMAPSELFSYLDRNNIEYIKTKSINNVIDAVSTHPDMQICNLGNGSFVCEPTIYQYYKNRLELYGVNLSKGSTALKSNYPYDIAYNVVITGSFMLHNLKYTDDIIMEYARKSALSIFDTKQGYTKCATCIIDDNAIITDDEGVYKNSVAFGIDCLLIGKDTIALGDRNDGFFGGCCGMIGNKKLLFCGNVETHKSYIEIKRFAEKYNVELVSAFDGPLTDIGSIIPVIQE